MSKGEGMMTCGKILLLCGFGSLLMLPGARDAVATPRAVDLVVEGELPFSKKKLTDLVRLRLPLAKSGDGKRVVVRSTGAGQVEIHVDGRTRRASIRPDAGQEGARIVTLLLLDLIEEDVAASSAVAPPLQVRRQVKSPVVSEPRLLLGMTAALSMLARDKDAAFEPQIDLGYRFTRTLWAFFEGGYSWTRQHHSSFESLLLRLGFAYQRSWLSIHGGGVLRHYWFGPQMMGFVKLRSGVLPGVAFAVRATYRFGRRVALYGGVGLDLLLKRDSQSVWDGRYRDTAELMHTNWAVPWFGMGIGYLGL